MVPYDVYVNINLKQYHSHPGSPLVWLHSTSNQLLRISKVSHVLIGFLVQWHIGVLTWKHYTDILPLFHWKVILKSGVWVLLDDSCLKYIFYLCLQGSHIEWYELPGVLRRWLKGFCWAAVGTGRTTYRRPVEQGSERGSSVCVSTMTSRSYRL